MSNIKYVETCLDGLQAILLSCNTSDYFLTMFCKPLKQNPGHIVLHANESSTKINCFTKNKLLQSTIHTHANDERASLMYADQQMRIKDKCKKSRFTYFIAKLLQSSYGGIDYWLWSWLN